MKIRILFLFFFNTFLAVFSQDFYDINTVQEIKVYLDTENWQFTLTKDNYYEADSIKINGTKFEQVGIKYKGNSTFDYSFAKNPFHIELDTYISQNYQGYKDIKLSNVFYDPSFIRETLSYDILSQYMHCPRANYAKLFINDEYIGFYVNTEAINKKFVNDKFGSSENTFIKGAPTVFIMDSDFKPNLVYFGTEQINYEPRYELKSDTGWDELINLIDILNNNTTQIEQVLDVDRALWMLAFNNVLVNLDSYLGAFNHNYYLYEDNNGRLNFIVWDLNMSFGTFDFITTSTDWLFPTSVKVNMSPYIQQNQVNWPLINKLLSNPHYKKKYLAKMKTIVQENFSNNAYLTKANQFRTLINTYVQNDPNKFYTYSEYQNNLTQDINVDNAFQAPGIQTLMNARKNYLLGLPEFTATKPVINNITTTIDQPIIGDIFTLNAQITNANANAVYVGHRNQTHQIFTKTPMFDDGLHNDGTAGDGIFGVSLTMTDIAMQYYIYAENNTIGTFSPERAEFEFHILQGNYATINPNEITINEFMAQNTTTITDPAGQFEDWIELYNTTNLTLSLDNLYLSDTDTNLQKWQFPTGLTLAPNSYLIVWADEDLTEEGLHANFKLSAGGESIILSYPDGTIINEVDFGVQTANISAARVPNGTGNFVFQTPTFNTNNETLSNNNFLRNNFNLYPNPAKDKIYISGNSKINQIEIYNTLGQKLKNISYNDFQIEIDIKNLISGSYIIKIWSNEHIQTFQFIKE